MTAREREQMESIATARGYPSVSEYLRAMHRAAVDSAGRRSTASEEHYGDLNEALSTKLGSILQGNSLEYLHHVAPAASVNLVVTSPPFGLVRKKSYGNEDADAYCEWFRPFAEGIHRVLKDDGSLVIDIGGAWKPGIPTRSLYHFKLLVMLCEEYGFHLAQEHYWWNPAKLPSPAEWVNVRRIRVKDAVNSVWWLSKTPFPKASNRRVLAPYSDSMKQLLKQGYKAKRRPSGHDISPNFARDNGGSVPPNLLAIANTESNGTYQDYCRENNIPIHPARFPSQLPEYFIRFLTDPGDVVVDPFGGSCVSGAVAEALGRRWTCIELDSEYVRGGMARFSEQARARTQSKPVSYTIAAPTAPIGDELPLDSDGGRRRTTPAVA
jgi:site-specific DNA-methyltransferase (cytosine-N4-specific)